VTPAELEAIRQRWARVSVRRIAFELTRTLEGLLGHEMPWFELASRTRFDALGAEATKDALEHAPEDVAALLTALDEQAAELARLRRVEAAARAVRDATNGVAERRAVYALYAALDGSDSGAD